MEKTIHQAALIPLEQYPQWQERRAAFFTMVNEVQERTRQIPMQELETVIGEAVAAGKGDTFYADPWKE